MFFVVSSLKMNLTTIQGTSMYPTIVHLGGIFYPPTHQGTSISAVNKSLILPSTSVPLGFGGYYKQHCQILTQRSTGLFVDLIMRRYIAGI